MYTAKTVVETLQKKVEMFVVLEKYTVMVIKSQNAQKQKYLLLFVK